MILMSRYKGQLHGGKRANKFGEGFPPLFGQCPNENVFFLLMSSLRRRLLFFSTRVKSIPICGAVEVPHCDCVPHRELNDIVISHISHIFHIFRNPFKGVFSQETDAPSAGKWGFCQRRGQSFNNTGQQCYLKEEEVEPLASVENLLRWVGMRYHQNTSKSHFLNRCFLSDPSPIIVYSCH